MDLSGWIPCLYRQYVAPWVDLHRTLRRFFVVALFVLSPAAYGVEPIFVGLGNEADYAPGKTQSTWGEFYEAYREALTQVRLATRQEFPGVRVVVGGTSCTPTRRGVQPSLVHWLAPRLTATEKSELVFGCTTNRLTDDELRDAINSVRGLGVAFAMLEDGQRARVHERGLIVERGGGLAYAAFSRWPFATWSVRPPDSDTSELGTIGPRGRVAANSESFRRLLAAARIPVGGQWDLDDELPGDFVRFGVVITGADFDPETAVPWGSGGSHEELVERLVRVNARPLPVLMIHDPGAPWPPRQNQPPGRGYHQRAPVTDAAVVGSFTRSYLGWLRAALDGAPAPPPPGPEPGPVEPPEFDDEAARLAFVELWKRTRILRGQPNREIVKHRAWSLRWEVFSRHVLGREAEASAPPPAAAELELEAPRAGEDDESAAARVLGGRRQQLVRPARDRPARWVVLGPETELDAEGETVLGTIGKGGSIAEAVADYESKTGARISGRDALTASEATALAWFSTMDSSGGPTAIRKDRRGAYHADLFRRRLGVRQGEPFDSLEAAVAWLREVVE